MASHILESPGQRVAEQLEVDIIPGTELMRDVRNVQFAHEGGSGRGIVPSDPLNWSRTWKLVVAVSQLLYVWVLVCTALSLAPLFPLLAEEFHLNQQQLSLLTGANVIASGLANLLIVPFSNILGRRTTAISFGILITLCSIWQALATTHTSLLAARACNGLVQATSETTMVQTVADMFFLHERGTWMAAYFTMYFSGAFLGPIMAGSIGAAHGWRSFFWLSTALSTFVVLLLIFCYPETKYHRNNLYSTNRESVKGKENSSMPEKKIDSEAASNTGLADDQPVGRGRPSKTQFAPFMKPDSRWKSFIIRDITTPIIVFFNPIVFWAALMLAGPADLVLIFNLTESGLLSSPPYGWSPKAVGYSNFAFFGGGIFGVLTAGPLSDWWARKMTVRNNGIREAEMRLPVLIPYCCFFLVCHVVGAVGYQQLWPWQAIVICGFGFAGLAVTSIPAISIAYAIDCYKPISGEIMVVGTVLKNVLGFGISYWAFDILQRDGWTPVYMIQFAVSMLPVVCTIPLYYYGKSLRRWTKDSGLHRMESMI